MIGKALCVYWPHSWYSIPRTPIPLGQWQFNTHGMSVSDDGTRGYLAARDGLIVVDLPPEEDDELCIPALKSGLNFIRLATPTTDDRRLPAVLANTSGFVYYVSTTGVTGARSELDPALLTRLEVVACNVVLDAVLQRAAHHRDVRGVQVMDPGHVAGIGVSAVGDDMGAVSLQPPRPAFTGPGQQRSAREVRTERPRHVMHADRRPPDEIVGGTIPREFIKPIDEGIKEALTRGVLAGYPIDDVKIQLFDGSYHDVDSSEMAFKIAGSMAFQDAAKKAKPVLLEPVMRVEVVVPKDYMGDVMGDLASRRGRIQSQEDRGGTQIINARVPLSEMFGYATDLRSRTQGRATYSMHFDRYEQAPQQVSEEVVARVQGR